MNKQIDMNTCNQLTMCKKSYQQNVYKSYIFSIYV